MQEKHKWLTVLIVCATVIGIAAFAGIVGSGDKQVSGKKKSEVTVRSHTPALKQADIRKHLEDAKTYVPPDPGDKVRNTIESYWARFNETPDAPDAPSLLEAMGNLYALRLGDHQMAAYCYQELLSRYPEYNKQRAYVGLVTALENSGETERATQVYNEMMRVYLTDSIEYKWAADRVGKERWEGPDFIRPGSPEEAELIKETEAAFAASRAAEEDEAAAEGESEATEGEVVTEETPDVVEGEAKV